jgi:mRNA interferase RelE/StbE
LSYSVRFSKKAEKELSKLDAVPKALILKFIGEKLNGSDNPTALSNAKELVGSKNGWRWRVGEYRVLGHVDGQELVIDIFRVRHRRSV